MSKKVHTFVAHAFPQHFKLGEFASQSPSSPIVTDPRDSITMQSSHPQGVVFAYNFGSLAFWNVSNEARKADIKRLKEQGPFKFSERVITEDFNVVEDPNERPRVEFSRLVLDKLTLERAEVVALTVAQSATMEYYESLVDDIWCTMGNLTTELEKKGRVPINQRKLYRQIGKAINMRNDVIGVMHLLDRPDVIWEDRIMDGLYGDLRAVFDLPERFQAIDNKLRIVQETLELLITTSRDQVLYWVEIGILTLIAVEIVLWLIETGFF